MESPLMKSDKAQSSYINLLDQLFEIERKTKKINEPNTILRTIEKAKEILEDITLNCHEFEGKLVYQNPIGEPYNETRTDLDAIISGDSTENLIIDEVIKPIIRKIITEGIINKSIIVRKGKVIVKSKK